MGVVNSGLGKRYSWLLYNFGMGRQPFMQWKILHNFSVGLCIHSSMLANSTVDRGVLEYVLSDKNSLVSGFMQCKRTFKGQLLLTWHNEAFCSLLNLLLE